MRDYDALLARLHADHDRMLGALKVLRRTGGCSEHGGAGIADLVERLLILCSDCVDEVESHRGFMRSLLEGGLLDSDVVGYLEDGVEDDTLGWLGDESHDGPMHVVYSQVPDGRYFGVVFWCDGSGITEMGNPVLLDDEEGVHEWIEEVKSGGGKSGR